MRDATHWIVTRRETAAGRVYYGKLAHRVTQTGTTGVSDCGKRYDFAQQDVENEVDVPGTPRCRRCGLVSGDA